MKSIGSYRISGFAVSVDKEIDRLKAQVELFWGQEYEQLRRCGLRDGMKILECGSGPGHILEKLLASFPASRITGIEIDPLLARSSRERLAEQAVGRLEIYERSVMQMEFLENTFDIVIARLLLEHLPDPVTAAREILRVLKPGGKGIFIDNDFDLHLRAFPDIPELAILYDAYCRCRIAEGGNPRIGRELPCVLKQAGFSNIDLEIVCAHSEVIGDEAFLRSEGSGIPAQLVRDGYLSRDVLDQLARKWHDALRQEPHAFFRELFVASGTKSEPHAGQMKSTAQLLERSDLSREASLILETEGEAERRQRLVDYLVHKLATLLSKQPKEIPIDRALIDIGVDSIASVDLSNRFHEDFNIELMAVDILESQSVEALAQGIMARFSERKAGPAPRSDRDEWEEGEI